MVLVTPKQVIHSYRAIAGLYTLSASLIWGVNTLFLLEAGLDILGVFIANATFTASMALFEIPTGIVADTVGRRAMLVAILTAQIQTVNTLGDFLYLPEVLLLVIFIWLVFSGSSKFSMDGFLARKFGFEDRKA